VGHGRKSSSPLPADLCVVCDTDVQLPAKNITHVKDGKLSPAMQDRFLRAEAANNNSFVGLPLFAGAIVRPLSPLLLFTISSLHRLVISLQDGILMVRSQETWPESLLPP